MKDPTKTEQPSWEDNGQKGWGVCHYYPQSARGSKRLGFALTAHTYDSRTTRGSFLFHAELSTRTLEEVKNQKQNNWKPEQPEKETALGLCLDLIPSISLWGYYKIKKLKFQVRKLLAKVESWTFFNFTYHESSPSFLPYKRVWGMNGFIWKTQTSLHSRASPFPSPCSLLLTFFFSSLLCLFPEKNVIFSHLEAFFWRWLV